MWHAPYPPTAAPSYPTVRICTCLQLGGDARAGMPCTMCPHPTCRHAPARMGVASCPACEVGTLVLDPVSAPSWRLDCSRCNILIYLPKNLHAAKVAADSCEVRCGLRLLLAAAPTEEAAAYSHWLPHKKASKSPSSTSSVARLGLLVLFLCRCGAAGSLGACWG
jgi:hypothetical protein